MIFHGNHLADRMLELVDRDEDGGELKKTKMEEVRVIKDFKRWNSKRKREKTKTKKQELNCRRILNDIVPRWRGAK
jgi:hypothetical protein